MKYYPVLYKINHLGMEKNIRSDVYADSLVDAALKTVPNKGSEWSVIMDHDNVVAHVIRQSNILSIQVVKSGDDA